MTPLSYIMFYIVIGAAVGYTRGRKIDRGLEGLILGGTLGVIGWIITLYVLPSKQEFVEAPTTPTAAPRDPSL